MEQCSQFNCNSRQRQTYRGSNRDSKETEYLGPETPDTVTEASKYRNISPSRPQCRRAVDNLMPEGPLLVSTELSSNFKPLVSRRPSSAREDYRRRRDTLRTEGNVSYQVEGKSSYLAHNTTRPKIYKPRPCQDCSNGTELKSSALRESTSTQPKVFTDTAKPQPREEKVKSRVRVDEMKERRIQMEERRVQEEERRIQLEERRIHEEERKVNLEPGLDVDWPSWSSQPETLGEHVRNVFLDLCSGLTVCELQQTYPHHWGLLLSRLSHRPDLRLQLLDRVNRGA